MSMKMMVRVMEEVDLPRIQLAVLSAMANYCDDDGRNCFPSVDRIAWLCGYKQRAIIDAMHELRRSGVIVEVAPAAGTRPAEYHLTIEHAPRKPSFDDWRAANGRHARGANAAPQRVPVDAGTDAEGAPLLDMNDATRGADDAPVQTAQGCKPRTLEVHSAQLGVHSTTSRGANAAPRTSQEPVKGTSQKNRVGGDPERPAREPAGPIANATRIPDDFTVTPEMNRWAIEKGLECGMVQAEIDRLIAWETEKFRNYWRAKGKDNTKRDWPATWRVWMQKAIEDASRPRNVTPIAGRRGNPERAISTSQDPKDWTSGLPLQRGGRPS